jgi:hypothetical protein
VDLTVILDAFRAGTIDAAGNIIKPESSIDPFEYFVIKLKEYSNSCHQE